MRRRGPQKHSIEKVHEALDMIRRGENPFRAAKHAGIARTTLLYHLEKMPHDDFPSGVNPLVEHIKQKIEILLWKTRLRLVQNIYQKSRKADAKTSTIMWKALNESPIPNSGTGPFKKPKLSHHALEDKITFREFILERKEQADGGEKPASENQRAASLDAPIDAEAAPETGESKPAEEG
ncbi:MAG: hypothetical protein ABII00_04125 [Elusimicrobiota bacterium]